MEDQHRTPPPQDTVHKYFPGIWNNGEPYFQLVEGHTPGHKKGEQLSWMLKRSSKFIYRIQKVPDAYHFQSASVTAFITQKPFTH